MPLHVEFHDGYTLPECMYSLSFLEYVSICPPLWSLSCCVHWDIFASKITDVLSIKLQPYTVCCFCIMSEYFNPSTFSLLELWCQHPKNKRHKQLIKLTQNLWHSSMHIFCRTELADHSFHSLKYQHFNIFNWLEASDLPLLYWHSSSAQL